MGADKGRKKQLTSYLQMPTTLQIKGHSKWGGGPCAGVILIPVYVAAAFSPGWPMLPPTRTSKTWWEVKFPPWDDNLVLFSSLSIRAPVVLVMLKARVGILTLSVYVFMNYKIN